MILESWNSCTWVMMLKKKIKINISRGAILTILSNRTWNGKVYLDLRNSHHRSVAHMTQVQEPERQKFTLSRHTCVFCYWNFKKQTQNSHRTALLPFILSLLCHECTSADVRNSEVKINLAFQIWLHWIVSIALESVFLLYCIIRWDIDIHRAWSILRTCFMLYYKCISLK